MKIKDWKELDKKRVDDVSLYVNEIRIDVTYDGIMLVGIIYSQTPKELIIGILKLFGFDIEFIEAPKLNDKQWHFVRSVDAGFVSRKHSGVLWFSLKEKDGMNHDSWTYFDKLVDFPFIKEGDKWSIADLRKLEKE